MCALMHARPYTLPPRGPGDMKRFRRGILSVAIAWLVCLGALPLALSQERNRRLEIRYTPPRLSVVARGVSLLQVLQAIGAKVGFVTIDAGAVRPTLAVSLQDATLEEVLRQLLRGENVAIIYRGGAGGMMQGSDVIETIILLGPRGSVEAARGLSQGQQPDADHRDPPRRSVGLPYSFNTLLPDQAGRATFEAFERAQERDRGEEATAVTVEGLLRAHALAGLEDPSVDMPQGATTDDKNPQEEDRTRPTEANPTATVPTELAETLALTTRLAQQHVQALIEGLNTATYSLLDSLAGQ